MKDDTISRAAALSALADYIHNVDRVMGDGHLSADDCMDAARSVLGEDELPSAQPVNIAKLQPNCNQVASDCISRQAMINEINLHVGILYDNPTLVESLKLLVWSLPSAQPGWIPITERLPEEETIYLITFGSGHVRLSSWHKDTKYNHGFDNIETGFLEDGTMVHFGVTAWMPLPKPYREGGQDGKN